MLLWRYNGRRGSTSVRMTGAWRSMAFWTVLRRLSSCSLTRVARTECGHSSAVRDRAMLRASLSSTLGGGMAPTNGVMRCEGMLSSVLERSSSSASFHSQAISFVSTEFQLSMLERGALSDAIELRVCALSSFGGLRGVWGDATGVDGDAWSRAG